MVFLLPIWAGKVRAETKKIRDYREGEEENGKDIFYINRDKTYFTLTGTRHYFGAYFLKKGMRVELEKEPDNEHDKEAIKVNLEGLGKIGYVANSTYTVLGESMSAGRLYDKIGDKAEGKVVLVTERGVLCKVCKKSLAQQNGQAAD